MAQYLVDWLRQRYPTAKGATLKRMVEQGRVRINEVVARKLKQELSPGDVVQVSDVAGAARDVGLAVRSGRSSPRNPRPESPIPILYEDDDVIVIDKPAGLLTSTIPREKRATAIAYLRELVKQRDPRARVGVIHRLDRDVSGLLVFSKNHAAYESLKKQFFHRTAQRVYMAAVEGVPKPRAGRIESNLVEHYDGHVYATPEEGKGERAITDYEVVEADGKRALVRVTLRTGRKHQIRVHLSERGWPIIGDATYRSKTEAARLMLAAIRLEFLHPRTGKQMQFEQAAPQEILDCLKPVLVKRRPPPGR